MPAIHPHSRQYSKSRELYEKRMNSVAYKNGNSVNLQSLIPSTKMNK